VIDWEERIVEGRVSMRSQKITFRDQKAICVFPDERVELEQAVVGLELTDRYPVIVLIGGAIAPQQAGVTWKAMQIISRLAENLKALVICGGTTMGVMIEIGRIRSQNHYSFPLLGMAPEELVTWPGGPRSTRFLWWGVKRWQLEPHHTHFILVPGGQFGDESPWIADAASILSKGHRSVTILINGGEISRGDVQLSLEKGRPVIAMGHTGRLADEFSRQTHRHKLITVVSATAEQRIVDVVNASLLDRE
jgi:hypothetical protein